MCSHMSHVCDVMSLGFVYNVNHVSMMLLVLTFHSCHIGLMWYNVIGVHVHECHVIMVHFALT